MYDEQGRRVQKDGITFTYDSQGRLIKQSNGLTFFYDHTGVAGFTYNNATYLYRKDAQKNVVAILNTDGTVLVRYAYDAWGNYTYNEPSGEGLGELNPFRYRSYYYDTETELYFLKTRYYDPEIGRFMTIDGVGYLAPDKINGLNLYAYCGNNPIMAIDPNGCSSIFNRLSGIIFQGAITLVSYVGAKIAASWNSSIQQDLQNLEATGRQGISIIGNDDASIAANANVISFYKGAAVFHWSNNMGSLSLGGIFLNRNSEETLQHEWGHTKQLRTLGLGTYLKLFAIPSFIGASFKFLDFFGIVNTSIGNWLNSSDYNYYYLPWERTADFFGGVGSRPSLAQESFTEPSWILSLSLAYYAFAFITNLF